MAQSMHYQDLIWQMQQMVDSCEGSLAATSGAIVPSKTFWYLVDFSGGNWAYKKISECPGQITVRNITGERETLRRMDTNVAEQKLSIHLAPDGNRRQQAQKMRDIAIEWVGKMKEGHLSRTEMWTALQSTVWRALMFPLPALNLTRKECQLIMAPLLEYILPALGICRNFQGKLVLAQKEFFGLCIKHGVSRTAPFGDRLLSTITPAETI